MTTALSFIEKTCRELEYKVKDGINIITGTILFFSVIISISPLIVFACCV